MVDGLMKQRMRSRNDSRVLSKLNAYNILIMIIITALK